MSTRLKIMSSSPAAPNDLLEDHRRALRPLWISIYSFIFFILLLFFNLLCIEPCSNALK